MDVSVHEVIHEGNLRELYKASGGAWGGTTVDDTFKDMLFKIFGQNVFTKFQKENMDDYLTIFRNFEVRKRTVSTTTERDTIIALPTTLVETYTKETKSTLKIAVQQSTVHNVVTLDKGNKLRIKAAYMRELFSIVTDNITKHIAELLCIDVVKGVKTVIMVGGLSKSSIVHETVKLSFPILNVVVPPDASVCVIKGAVVFGFKPTAITERISQYTYGLEQALPFEDGVHPTDKLCHDSRGKPLCKDCFHKIIECGLKMKLKQQFSGEFDFIPTRTTGMCFYVYGSTEPNPKFVTDDSCFFVGGFEIKFPDAENQDNLNKQLRVYLVLGDTEMRVVAKDIHTEERHSSQFKLKDMLNTYLLK